MKRRNFLRTAGTTAALTPFIHKGFSINPLARNSIFGALGAAASINGKKMVFIELAGGNDGLNTLIPLDQYGNLSAHRPSILIPENKVLNLQGVTATGLHPSMTGLQEMYNDGLVSIVQSVGYPEQDYSHFRSMDIWQTASDNNQFFDTGWLGRMLEGEYPGFPDGYPNQDNPDPLAIQIGSIMPLAFMGSAFPMGMSISSPDSFYEFVNDFAEPTPATPYGDELEYIRVVMQQSQQYYESVKTAADNQPDNLSSKYPPEYQNNLADQLRIVARLIGGGLQTAVYIVSVGGFDTHSEQADPGAPDQGYHADLLGRVSEAIAAFQDDIRLMGKDENVAGMTFSEFGRTIAANGSIGTDHGAAAPLFVFGKGVNPGIIGGNPDIPQNLDVSSDVPMAHDFRQVYASVLQDWFGLTNLDAILYQDFAILPIFKTSTAAKETRPDAFSVGTFPNPVRSTTTITFNSFSNASVVINLLDAQGRFIV
ncbi:MAG: DUF1501 domain-containing protein, partial [Bacteroidetes bacterium]|nr:DUF1501 domain-containing protein [Bacteroidota bacterium]